MLTAEQESYFDTFGFLLMQQYFSPEEMNEITQEFDNVLTEERGGTPFTGEEQSTTTIVEHNSFFTQLVEADRIYKRY